jgi:hypothetical protein
LGFAVWSDLMVAAIGVLGLVASTLWVIPLATETRLLVAPAEGPPIGTASELRGAVRRRAGQSLTWREIPQAAAIFEHDSIFVPAEGSATVFLTSGSELHLGGNSLVVLERRSARSGHVRLVRGTLEGRAGSGDVRIDTGSGSIALQPRGDVHVRVADAGDVGVQMLSGAAVWRGAGEPTSLQGGEGAQVNAAGEVLGVHTYPVTLVRPSMDARVLATELPVVVDLSWTGALNTEKAVARSTHADFRSPETVPVASGDAGQITIGSYGTTWWRLVDGRGEPLSPARSFAVLKDEPAQPLTPKPGQLLLAPPGSGISFSWTSSPSCPEYRVDVASSDTFEQIVVSKTTSRTQWWMPRDLPEATYRWRVIPCPAERTGMVQFVPATFRLITRPIPQTPDTIDAQIEIVRDVAKP